MKRLVPTAVVAAALMCAPATALATDGQDATTTAPTVETTTWPFTDAVYNTCTDELIVVNGNVTVRTSMTLSGSDMVYRMTTWYRGAGESDKGGHYTYGNVSYSGFRTRAEQTFFDSTDLALMRLRRDDRAPGTTLTVWMVKDTTINQVTGDIDVRLDTFKTTCR